MVDGRTGLAVSQYVGRVGYALGVMLGAHVAGEPTDVRYYAVAHGNKLDQRRTLSQRSAVVPTPVNIMFHNINIHIYIILYILFHFRRTAPDLRLGGCV